MIKNKYFLILLVRLFLGYIFFSAGVCKLTHGNFGQLIGPPWLEELLAKHGLGLFAQVVAVSQVVCGALLLSQRFSLLGAIMLIPMNVAILAVTVSQKWVGTPYVNTVFLLLNLLLLGIEREKFRFLVQPQQAFHVSPSELSKIGQNTFSWLGLGFSLLTMIAAFFSLILTNIFALLAFTSFAFTILRSVLHRKLDPVLIALPFVAMVILTFAKFVPYAQPVLAAVLLTEALLLPIRLYQNKKADEDAAPASIAAG